ncbi:MAG: T9SS type A sorting domain-containing protein, partial [Chitinivibrionales bacterium]|nr:T9SS type A sorting domain-containing protein [Chitinivibrionales bacterium]
YWGYIEITEPGNYTFYLSADDGAQLHIDGALLVDLKKPTGSVQQDEGSVYLTEGKHSIVVTYFQNGGESVCNLEYEGPNVPRTTVPSSVLYHIDGNACHHYEHFDSLGDAVSNGFFEIKTALLPGTPEIKMQCNYLVITAPGNLPVSAELFTVGGRKVAAARLHTNRSVRLPKPSAKGVYYLHVAEGRKSFSEKIVIK